MSVGQGYAMLSREPNLDMRVTTLNRRGCISIAWFLVRHLMRIGLQQGMIAGVCLLMRALINDVSGKLGKLNVSPASGRVGPGCPSATH